MDLDVIGMVSRVGRGMGVLDGSGDCRRGRGSFGGCVPPLAHWFQWHIFNRNVFDSCVRS